jgi:hypothetical protein
MPDEPIRHTATPRPERRPVVLNKQFLADAETALAAQRTAKAVTVPPPCRAARIEAARRRRDEPIMQFFDRTVEGWPRTWRVITLLWAFAAAASLLLFAAMKAVELAGLAMTGLVLAKLVDQVTRRRSHSAVVQS